MRRLGLAVQVHPVDAIQFVDDVFGLEFGDGVRHAGSGVRFGVLLYSLPLDGSMSGFFPGSCRAAGPDTPRSPFHSECRTALLTNEAGPQRSVTTSDSRTSLLQLAWSEAPPH